MSKARFLDKTLLAVANVAKQSLLSEAFAYRKGFLQALDVRIKLVTFVFIIVLISISHTVAILWLFYGLSVLLAALSRVSIGSIFKRVWLFVPLFSAMIVLPAALNIVTPGDELWRLAELGHERRLGPYTIPEVVTVTRQGVWGGIIFVSRVAASVSFAVLFTLTTRWADVFSGLRSLFVPRIFIVTLSMTYRYLFVFLRLVQDMYRARKSRTIRPLSGSEERNWTASRIGVTFRKSLDMSEDIYRAMLSRGFQGEFRSINRFHPVLLDYIWLVTVLLFGGILIVFQKGLV